MSPESDSLDPRIGPEKVDSSFKNVGVAYSLDDSNPVADDGLQLKIDFRTGFPTAIGGSEVSDELRATCSSINRDRICGLLEAAQEPPSSGSLPPDVWKAAFKGRAREWEVPIVDLRALGLEHDTDGFIVSEDLIALPPGAEAQPYLDSSNRVVYKLFPLQPNGSLGRKLDFRSGSEGVEVTDGEATWIDTLEKLAVLNAGGGLPSEIIGLADSGDYLIAKQPFAFPIKDFDADLREAERRMRGVRCVGGGLRVHVIVSHVDGFDWVLGDLHQRNVLRDHNGQPVIIDALMTKVTPKARKSLPWLKRACEEARAYRETGIEPKDPFEDCVDDEL